MSDQDNGSMTTTAPPEGGPPEEPGPLPPPPPNPFDSVRKKPNSVEISRDVAHPPGAGRGLCGRVPGSPNLKQIVQQRWGGGVYTAQGFDSNGHARDMTFELPGPSVPLVEEEEEDGPTIHWPPFGGYPGYQQPQQILYDQLGRPVPVPPYAQQAPQFAGAFSRANNREIERLTRENDQLKQQIQRLEDNARRDERELRSTIEGLQRSLDAERTKAMIADLNAQHQKSLSDLQLKLASNHGEPTGDNRVMFEALRSNGEILASVIAANAKGNLGPAELLTLVNSMKGGGIKDALALHRAIQEASGANDGDESWQSVVKSAVKNVAPIAKDFVAAQVGVPEAEQQQQQPKQIPQQQAEEPVSTVPWIKIMRKVTAMYTKGNSPAVSASHFRSFCEGLDDWKGTPTKAALLPGLSVTTAAALCAELEKLVVFFEGEDKIHAQAFVNVLKDEKGQKWIDEFLSSLVPSE